MIRDATGEDAESICSIYNLYVRETVITFEEEEVSTEAMSKRIADVTATHPWLVWEEAGKIIGYAYARKWQERAAYRHTAEATVYVAQGNHGKGIGSTLYREVLARLKPLNVHTVIGGVALPNEKSMAMHEKLGFKKVAHYQEVGRKFGQWIDVGYWQLKL